MQDDALLGNTDPDDVEHPPSTPNKGAFPPGGDTPTDQRNIAAFREWRRSQGNPSAADRELANDCRLFAESVERQGTPWAHGCANVLRLAADALTRVRSSSGAPNPDDAPARRANPKDTVDTIQKGG